MSKLSVQIAGLGALTGNLPDVAYAMPQKPSNHAPGAAAQATTTVAARSDGGVHICTGVSATIACGATPQTPLNVFLRDGATGAGTVLMAWAVAAPANGQGAVVLSDLCIPGSANTAMTLEFSAAGAAATVEAVTLTYVDAIP